MKKRRDFLPRNKIKMSFLFLIDFVGARMTWQKRIGQEHFSRIIDAWRDVSAHDWTNHFTRIANDDATCQAMIAGITSRGSLTMMRRVRPWLKESFHADRRGSYPLSQKFRHGNHRHIINPCQVQVGERIKLTAQIAPTYRRDIRRSRRRIKPKFWGQLSLPFLFPSMPSDL